MTVQPVPSAPSSDLVITYFGWWDCPRGGIVAEDGHPHYFRSDFSEELDDYDPVSGSGRCQMKRSNANSDSGTYGLRGAPPSTVVNAPRPSTNRKSSEDCPMSFAPSGFPRKMP